MSTEMTRGGQAQDLAAVMEWARAAQGASIVPEAYRNKPADMMIAANLGASMGLSPAESLYRISVIKGKPTASAELITSKVREAGHRLRIEGDETTATCTIVRSDDPDYEFKETRDLAWAKRMGLSSQPNYTKQPGTMLKNRAITACARLACPEALYGVAYTPDEMNDFPDTSTRATADEVLHQATSAAEADPEPEVARVTTRQKSALNAQIKRLGLDKDTYLELATGVAGRDVGATDELSEPEAGELLAMLADQPDPPAEASAETAKAAVRAAREQEPEPDDGWAQDALPVDGAS